MVVTWSAELSPRKQKRRWTFRGRLALGTLLSICVMPSPARSAPAPAKRSQLPNDRAQSERPPPVAQRLAQPANSEPTDEPWRAAKALSTPSWLSVGLSERTRYEHLSNQFRAGIPGDAGALSLRTLLLTEVHLQPVTLGVEVADSRLYFATSNTPIGTTLVNPLDLLQAYTQLEFRDLFQPSATGYLRVGRMTMDVGSRRFVARNRFRNTLNAFTGIDLKWTSKNTGLQAFANLPVHRLPNAPDDLRDNKLEFDTQDFGTVFWGVFYASQLWTSINLEAFLFGLHEKDTASVDTHNRQLYTPGVRLYRKPAQAKLDFELELVAQGGRSHASAKPEDTQELKHQAAFGHLAVGHTFDASWKPRLSVLYDYASGDKDPNDNVNGRFDTLYGARRFEYGPTGLYGAFARSNISSPGVRFEFKYAKVLDGFIGYRAVWLAQAKDAWTSSGLVDPSGASGSFVGQQMEVRFRWNPWRGNLGLELGAAHIFLGEFAHSAPNANSMSNPTYIYSQMYWAI